MFSLCDFLSFPAQIRFLVKPEAMKLPTYLIRLAAFVYESENEI